MKPVSNFPVLLVAVCTACVKFFQITVVPAVIVTVLGLKTKAPELFVVIFTTTCWSVELSSPAARV